MPRLKGEKYNGRKKKIQWDRLNPGGVTFSARSPFVPQLLVWVAVIWLLPLASLWTLAGAPASAGFIDPFFFLLALSWNADCTLVRMAFSSILKGALPREVWIFCGTRSSSVTSQKLWRVTERPKFKRKQHRHDRRHHSEAGLAWKPAQSGALFKLYSGPENESSGTTKLNCEVLGKHLPRYTAAWLFC